MTDELLIDVSWSRPDPAAVAAAGYRGVIGYSSADPTKNMTPGYAGALHAAGLGVLVVFETTANRSLGGAEAGVADAAFAFAQCDALGYPRDVPLLFNVGDFAATAEDMPGIDAYYQAIEQAATNPGQPQRMIGGYGTAFIIDSLVTAGRSGTWWQNAMNDVNEAGDVVSANTDLYQRVTPTRPAIAGASYDEDVVVNNRVLALWLQTPVTPAPPVWVPPPAPAPPAPVTTGPDGNPFTVPPLAIDGVFGQKTCRAEQWKTGTNPDGVFGLQSKLALQRHLGVQADGVIGRITVSALQRKVGARVDGLWGQLTTEALQRSLNQGSF